MTPILAGGDHFAGFRFYQSVYPILLLTFFNCVRFIVPAYVKLPVSGWPRMIRVVAGGVLLGLFVVVQVSEWTKFDRRLDLAPGFGIASAGRSKGADIEELFSGVRPLPDVATITVGGLQYGYAGPVVDLMRLNDVRMAHNGGTRMGIRSHAAFERHTFYEMEPAMLIPLVQFSDDLDWLALRIEFVNVVLKGLLDDARFRRTYRLAEVRKRTSGGVVSVAAWYRRDFLAELDDSNAFEIIRSAQVQ